MSSREIKFRARRTDNGEFVYGFYVVASAATWGLDVPLAAARICHTIITSMAAEPPTELYHIDPKTVGQYTGLKDKNGLEIYEGDLLIMGFPDEPVGEVVFLDGEYTLRSELGNCHLSAAGNREVIGNIHENPELVGA